MLYGVWRTKITHAGRRTKTGTDTCTGSYLLSSGLYRRRRTCTELLPCGSRASQPGWATVDRELESPPHPAPKVLLFNCGFIMAKVTQWVKYEGLAIGDQGLETGSRCARSLIPSPYSPVPDPSSSSFSERRWGKRITSRMVSLLVKSMARRSMPMPKPPVGGIP